jgi:hypothetical protein
MLLIFDMKMDFTRKIQFVAGVHVKTDSLVRFFGDKLLIRILSKSLKSP